MQEMWMAFTILQKVFFIVAAPATLILVIQLVLLLFGLGSHGAPDTDVDGDFVGDDFGSGDFGHDGLDIHDAPGIHETLYVHDGHDVSGHGPLEHGGDADGDGGQDDEGGADHGLRVFTVRGILTFLAVGGWCGLVLTYTALPDALVVINAAALGFIAMLLMALMIKSLLKLQYVPQVRTASVIGRDAEVYITIPPNNSGLGKIMVELGGQLSEMDAITYSDTPLSTGTLVTVTDVFGRAAVVEKAL